MNIKAAVKKEEACLCVARRQVKEYEHKIDQMAYDLYGLNEDEIKIIDGD